jgi:hypothetical protein
VVKGQKTPKEALAALRKAARNKDYTVRQILDPRGRPRGKGSHEAWGLYDAEGDLVARSQLTKHPGAMSPTVTRSFEEAFESALGERWMEK